MHERTTQQHLPQFGEVYGTTRPPRDLGSYGTKPRAQAFETRAGKIQTPGTMEGILQVPTDDLDRTSLVQ